MHRAGERIESSSLPFAIAVISDFTSFDCFFAVVYDESLRNPQSTGLFLNHAQMYFEPMQVDFECACNLERAYG